MHDIAEFLKAHEPFRGQDEGALESLARTAEVEFLPAGEVIFRQGEPPPDRIRVVRRGAIELLEDGRTLDLLGEGEMFGHPSMLSGLPTGFEARADEDSLVYLLGASEVVPLLARPESMRFVARSLLERGDDRAGREPELSGTDLARRRAAALVTRPAASCGPDAVLRDVARLMGAEGADSILVEVGGKRLGIVTDRDLREALADARPIETPVTEVMTSPVITVGAEQSAAAVLVTMLDNDIRHLPVVSPGGEVLGVVGDRDLLAAEARTPFALRRAIARAPSERELREIAGGVRAGVIALYRAGFAPAQVSEVISVVADALTRRMIELVVEERGEPPVEFAWLALGSHGRREPVPSSDIDSGMSWRDPADPDAANRYMRALAEDVAGCMQAVGWRLDPHGVTAAGEFGASSIGEWRSAIADWLERAADARVLIAITITLDGRVVQGTPELDPRPALCAGAGRPRLLALMLRAALEAKPPTGFLRDIVVEQSGEHRGTFDIKRGGLGPVTDLARYAALRAGAVATTSTQARLRAAATEGPLGEERARTLEHAYELFAGLRMEHQARQLERDEEPDDHLDPRGLDSLTRRYLRDAFREVAAVQRFLAGALDSGRGRI